MGDSVRYENDGVFDLYRVVPVGGVYFHFHENEDAVFPPYLYIGERFSGYAVYVDLESCVFGIGYPDRGDIHRFFVPVVNAEAAVGGADGREHRIETDGVGRERQHVRRACGKAVFDTSGHAQTGDEADAQQYGRQMFHTFFKRAGALFIVRVRE